MKDNNMINFTELYIFFYEKNKIFISHSKCFVYLCTDRLFHSDSYQYYAVFQTG